MLEHKYGNDKMWKSLCGNHLRQQPLSGDILGLCMRISLYLGIWILIDLLHDSQPQTLAPNLVSLELWGNARSGISTTKIASAHSETYIGSKSFWQKKAWDIILVGLRANHCMLSQMKCSSIQSERGCRKVADIILVSRAYQRASPPPEIERINKDM